MREPAPVGCALAGGAGSRIGGEKAAVQLGGRSLVVRVARTLALACGRVVVVCKPDSVLGALPAGIERWDEPAEPRHPRAGIAYALERARGPVLVCATDMPFVTCDALEALLAARGDALAVLACSDGRVQPVLGVYEPGALELLARAAVDEPLRATVAALDPWFVDLPATVTRSLDTREALQRAEAELGEG